MSIPQFIPKLSNVCCQFMELVHARARRRFQRGLKRKPMGLIKKLRKAKKEAPPNEKPAVVKTHLRDMIIVPEMIGSVVGIYNGKVSIIDMRRFDSSNRQFRYSPPWKSSLR
jgi:ribosomal protein uS19